MNIPHDDMKPYIPNFQYFLSDASTEDEDKYNTSVVIKCWFIIVKYIKESALRDKLFEVVKLLHDFLDQETAVEYIDIFLKYLTNTDNQVRKADAVKAIETIFPERGADMVKGWAKEYVEEGMQQGLLTADREMVIEALDIKFSNNVPEDIHKKINSLNNRILLKKLQEIPPEQMQTQ